MSDITTDDLARIDAAGITSEHWKIMFISGMGFFTDAYDLFIIGVAMRLIKDEWHPPTVAVGLVTSTALLAAAVGALVFGRVADMLGRKRIYGYEVLVLAAGAIASAFSPNIWWLIGFRIILGLGIGGDYPVSSTLMSEYAGKASRGMMVSLVFAMQAAGLIIGPLLAAGLLASGISHDLTWRLLLAFGAIPALAVLQMRRRLAETPRYRLAAAQRKEAKVLYQPAIGLTLQRRSKPVMAGLVPAISRRFRYARGFGEVSFFSPAGIIPGDQKNDPWPMPRAYQRRRKMAGARPAMTGWAVALESRTFGRLV